MSSTTLSAAGAPPSVAAFDVRGVCKEFPRTGVTALQDVDLRVPAGSFAALIGPSGCGKSTLLNILSGLAEPTSGAVDVYGRPVAGPPDEVGFMFQQPTLLPWRTVLENVLVPIQAQQGRRAARAHRDRARELLTSVGLGEFETSYPHEISGGMAQRTAICRMLITEPRALLLDEPFGALDEMSREAMDIELHRISRATDATVIMVTHSIPEAVLLADQVVVMSARPGCVARVIDIPLGRVRTRETLVEPAFGRAVTQVREALMGGARRG
ncbi:ABC transporter ATP-binding protein [Nocardioides sp. L-11A]|uniref:ABC transporter ATP-binding protein n=1 Tax=Nocardioides sp. L-11A TaxID=3043848 RepID=UPI00249A165D|nr:ABC transporter ATP-binding protein [Nocardioides sp. L-11A]